VKKPEWLRTFLELDFENVLVPISLHSKGLEY